jgi:hypothetical protein
MISGSSLRKLLREVPARFFGQNGLDYCMGLMDNEERMCASVLRLLENPNALAIRQKKPVPWNFGWSFTGEMRTSPAFLTQPCFLPHFNIGGKKLPVIKLR